MEEELETKLLVDVARLDPEGETLEGEVDIIDLDEPFVKPFGGVRYRLTAQLFGTELLVRGHLEQDFDLVCSRCGETFDTTIKVDDFTASVEVSEKQDFADLTTDARESIILALPTYPLCDEDCPGIAQKVERPADDRWGALDGLKVD
ncbi:MAG: YceD family protein [Kiritimatiellia bacterium]